MANLDLANVGARDVQGARGNFAPVWDGDDGATVGSFIPREIATRMVDSTNKVDLQTVDGRRVSLATAAEWAAFCDTYLRAPANSGTTDQEFMAHNPKGLTAQFGLSYANLCRALDDAGSQVKSADNPAGFVGETIEILPGGAWDVAAKIYGGLDNYGRDLMVKTPVQIAPNRSIDLVPSPKIGPEILNATMPFTRERDEVEEQYEVLVTDNQSARRFRDLSGNECFQPLDVTKLGPYQERAGAANIWQDDRAVGCFERFPYPMHLEVSRDDDTGYQINRSPFIEGFVDTDDFKLHESGQMDRFRWRPEQAARTNLQGKQNKGRDPVTGLVVQRKFEHRSPDNTSGTGPNGEALHLDLMERAAITGMIGMPGTAEMSSVHREIYKGLVDKGSIRQGDSIGLQTKVVCFQDRRRTHLIFYSLAQMQALQQTLTQNRAQFDQLTAGADPADVARWKGNLDRMIDQVGVYVEKLARRDELLRKYGGNVNASFDGLIISRDEKVGFEAGSFGNGSGIWPGDRRGRPAVWVVGQGGDYEPQIIDGADAIDPLGPPVLRAESELDTNVSDPVDDALASCRATATGQPVDGHDPRPNIPRADAERDLLEITKIRNDLGLCSRAAMELQAEAFEAGGLRVNRKPEEQTYDHFASELQRRGNRSWFNVLSIRNA